MGDRPHYYRKNWKNRQDADYEPINYVYEPEDELDEAEFLESDRRYGQYPHPHNGHLFHQDMYQTEWGRERDRSEKYFYKIHGPQKWDNEKQEIDFLVNFIINAPHNPRIRKVRVRMIRATVLDEMVRRRHLLRATLEKALPLARRKTKKFGF